MGSKGSTQQVVNQNAQYTPSPQITAAGTQALQGGQAAAQQPFWLPQQPVAPFSPDQLAAFQNVRNIQGMTAPWFQQAGNLSQMSATPLTADQIANFYNPMAQNVTNQLQNIYGQQMRDVTGKLTQAAGGVGADRIAVGQAQLANQQGLASGQIYAQLYQQALQAAEQNQQMQGQAAFTMGNLGQGAQGAALQGSQALLGVGGLQQQLAQANLMAPYAWLGQQFAYPYQANQYLAGITGALVPAFPSTTTGQSQTTTTPPQPSPISQGLGLGMAAYGAYSGSPGKGTSYGTVGGTNPFTGSASAIYRHGGRVHRQMGGQAGSGFGSISPFTSNAQVPGPGIPPPAIQALGSMQTAFDPSRATQPGAIQAPQFPGSLGITEALENRQRQAATAPEQMQQGGMQQAMQSPQMQQLFQRYPWLQGLLQSAPQGQGPAFAQSQMGRMQNPSFGTGAKGGFAGRGFADGGAAKAPAIPQMTAGTASDMDAYFANINKQAQDLSAMSRYAMQPTGTGGWTRSSFGQPAQAPSTDIGGRNLDTFFSDAFNPKAMPSPFDQTTGKLNPGFAAGGASDSSGGIGDDPFGNTDNLVPNVHLTPSSFHGPDLPKISSSGTSSSGKGSNTGSQVGQVIGIAAQVLPMLLAARGGAVGPFSHYQHFQEGGGDAMTDINTFPFTPADASPAPPSPEDLRPPVPTPFTGLGESVRAGLEGLRPTRGEFATPQEAEQARVAKELFAKQVAGIPEPVPGTPPTEQPVASPFLPKPTRNMTYETAGAAAPTPPATSSRAALPAAFNDPESGYAMPDIQATAPVTPVQRGDIPKGPFDLPVTVGGTKPAPEEAAAFKPPVETPFQPPPSAIPAPQEAAAFQPPVAPAMPRPRPDIPGPAGQAFAPGAPPVPPVSRQSVAQDTLYFANKNGIPPQIALRLINRESGFNPNVRGAAGEIGAGQLMPGTARDLGVNPHDPQQNLDGAMRYLKQQYDRFGNWPQAIAAYNAGPGAVASGRIPASTRAYVADVAGGGPLDTTQLSAKGLAATPDEGTVGPVAGPAGPTPSSIGQYQLPAGQMPFPQAGAQAPGADLARNPWVMAGLNIAGGTSPWAAVNIGRGAASALEKQREQAEKEVGVNQKAQDLWLQMQKHVDTMTKLTPAQEAAGWQMTFDPVHGTPMLFNPRSMKSYTYQGGRWNESDVGAAMTAAPGTAPGQATPGVAPGQAAGAPPEAAPVEAQPAPAAPAAPVGANPGGLVMPTDETIQKYGAGPAFNPKTGQVRPDVKAENDKVNTAASTSADAIRETERSINEIESNADVANKALATSAGGLGKFLLGPGSGSDARFKAAQFLATYGPDELNKQLGIDRNAVGAITEINKEQAYLAANRTRMLGAREAYQVLELMMRSNPGWEQTPEGRARVINAYKTAIEREKDYQKFLMSYRQKYGNNVAGAQQAFDALNPSQRYVDRANKLAEYEGRSNQQPAPVRAKIYDMPKNKQIEMYDNLPILLANRNNQKVIQSFDRNYNGLSSAFLGGG